MKRPTWWNENHNISILYEPIPCHITTGSDEFSVETEYAGKMAPNRIMKGRIMVEGENIRRSIRDKLERWSSNLN